MARQRIRLANIRRRVETCQFFPVAVMRNDSRGDPVEVIGRQPWRKPVDEDQREDLVPVLAPGVLGRPVAAQDTLEARHGLAEVVEEGRPIEARPQ